MTSFTEGNPIEGQNYTIRCDVTDGNPQTGVTYEWERDGWALGETGATLTVADVERSMSGSSYTCATDNRAGMGEQGAAYTFIVWCTFISVVLLISCANVMQYVLVEQLSCITNCLESGLCAFSQKYLRIKLAPKLV